MPEYANVWGPKQQSDASQPKDRPQSQQMRPGPKGQQKQQESRSVTETSVVDDFDRMSLSNVSSTSTSSASSKSSAIPTSALIPVAPNKGSGQRGRAVTVDVNFLPLLIDKLLPKVYQYDVSIEPNLPKRLLPRIFEQYRHTNYKNIFIAFDGQKIAVSPQILPIHDKIEKQTKVLDENGRERTYMVSMKEARDSEINFQSLKK